MALESNFSDLRAMHLQDLSSSREKLKFFPTGWMGGPDIYSPKFGHPMGNASSTLQNRSEGAQSMARLACIKQWKNVASMAI
ncbi:hypothetical protein [Polynucleobacter necessarius]|uniref:globin domain-containing protein n=1 Tax=Polynucleobacter necessarius TaxID=576610 RepID=UPI002F92CAE2